MVAWRENLRQRLFFQQDSIGLAIGILFTALVGLAICALYVPIGPAQPTAGIILGFHLREFEEGARTYARVDVRGDERLVRLNFRTGCRVGDRLHMQRTRTLTGERLSVRLQTPTCER